MAMYRSLRKLANEENGRTKSFFTVAAATSSLISAQQPYTQILSPPLSHGWLPFQPSRFLSPLSKWFVPFRGPLFLSSPPWKLLQSSTPLYLRGNRVVLRKVEALNLKLELIRNRAKFPVKLGFGSVDVDPAVVADQLRSKEEEEKVVEGKDGIMESFMNIPNMISMGRLFSGPVLWWMIANDMYSSAFVVLAISGATDWLDGYVARKMKINSVVGSYLDPFADKVLIGCVALAMVQKDLLHPGLVGLVVSRDIALVGGAVYQRAISLDWKQKSWKDFFNLDGTSPHKVEPLFISKVNTVFQLVLVAGALLQPEFGTPETETWITYLSWLVASTTMASTAAYGAQYMRNRSALSLTR